MFILYILGEWEVSVLYDNEHISGSPYLINVFDPSLVKVYGLEGGSMSSGITFNSKSVLLNQLQQNLSEQQ